MTLKNLIPSFGKKSVPVRYRERDPFTLLHEDMDNLLENFFSGFGTEPFGSRQGTFYPDIEVSESDKELRVTAELAGMDEKDIDVSLSHDTLTISGEKKEENARNEKGYYLKERSYGSFTRTIPIYPDVDADKIDAHFKKGVLTVTLPKTRERTEEKKKIKITD